MNKSIIKSKVLSKVVSRIIGFFISALICKWLYDAFLLDVFKTSIRYVDWLLIKLILNLLSPTFFNVSFNSDK